MDEREKLNAKIKSLEEWRSVLVFFLAFLAIVSTVTWNNMKEENERAQETISALEETISEEREKYNELEGVVQSMDEYIATLEEQVYFQETSEEYSGGSTYSQSETETITVYVTNTGSKYHKNGCQYLSQSKNAISLSNAKAAGYTACSRCY